MKKRLMSKRGFGKFLLGAGIGAGLGMLFAPKKGSALRKDLKEKLNELIGELKEVNLEDVKQNIIVKVDEIKLELENLDKEKALNIAQRKGKELQKKAEELFELAKEKGTPVLMEIAAGVRKQTISVVKEVLKKLEESDTKPDTKKEKEPEK